MSKEAEHLKDLRHLPVAVQAVLALEPQVIAWSEEFARKENALFLGRGLHYPIALEGALKLKEISYIHAEALPGRCELKHGPLALVTSEMPVVTIAPTTRCSKSSRAICRSPRPRWPALLLRRRRHPHRQRAGAARHPHARALRALSPILHVIPLQLLAYHTVCARGLTSINPATAKSVTVG